MIKYKLMHPEIHLVVDEVGNNISQRGDDHFAREKYCCEHINIPNNKASHNDRQFTLLGFTALAGESVLCAVIVSGIMHAFEVEIRIDIDAPVFGSPLIMNTLK